MNGRHTPGPWKVERDGKDVWIMTDGRMISGSYVMDLERNLETDMANARLIAAAPEMYRLLEYLGGSEEPFSTRDRLQITDLLARVRGAQ